MYLLPKGALFLAECEKGRRARGGGRAGRIMVTGAALGLGSSLRGPAAFYFWDPLSVLQAPTRSPPVMVRPAASPTTRALR